MLQCFQVQGSLTCNENLILFLHGLGDTHESLFTLGQAMQLPQTAFASFRAPHALPFELGYAWLDPSLDRKGEVLPHHVYDPKRLHSLDQVVAVWMDVLSMLQIVYNWPLHRIFLMGFGHGGTVALHVAAACRQRLGGVVSVSGALLRPTCALTSATPGLMLHSTCDPLILTDVFQATATAMPLVKTKCFDYFPIGLSNQDEMRAIMQFYDENLYLRNLALEQQADVFEL
ncbi:hypothetical protein H310_14458 [Aphanomyces invadans]|uniref:Phospholipase/carboxylesterase/thioesterase domain-containing protein n=1 Tax=Aphanomyces invadans TaxID=157072 RepID=A0A024T9R7_9STRA|nr:hypothetical protein H310_14458 [Aphanomyces invadans]ETV90788.1 hypothetical protein H310_14458 [Aphanomyces invadans]|eukprot:XP_008880545.1 hypothetical protein H310_14458 [Aphanomyces invadans]